MNRDELEGKAEALKGKIKQAAGTLTRDPDLHDEGVVDEVAGKTQAAVGRTKRKIGDAIEHVGESEVRQALARRVPELHVMDLEQVGLDCPSERRDGGDVEPLDTQVLLLVKWATRRGAPDVGARRPVLA